MKTKNEVSAGGIVYRKVGNKIEWLITQHSQHKGWVFPKGLVGDTKDSEAMEDAARREVKEEGGVEAKIANPKPVKTSYFYVLKNTRIAKTVYYFLMEYVAGDPKDHDWEMCDAKFVAEDEVRKTLTYKSDKEAFEKILNLY
ncbi:NUDIX hydrolase [Candidatus Roizmanbacteria bacterium CG09_land_8_20_14_0_10_41_9]|uniref:NUDIX hydrolase n=1 Tax=Candidatus Roizmanbacteria bacterium CG09_land_8_20_14_0_10_41_9 TaxID=1974850 RepID=A0A2H0WTV3_9BACT|nr:MAG: NUDIX hydrolase [Candidatus Roizmanbacteria bacterium CG09_land_8_20_14_0_10_41_9]